MEDSFCRDVKRVFLKLIQGVKEFLAEAGCCQSQNGILNCEGCPFYDPRLSGVLPKRISTYQFEDPSNEIPSLRVSTSRLSFNPDLLVEMLDRVPNGKTQVSDSVFFQKISHSDQMQKESNFQHVLSVNGSSYQHVPNGMTHDHNKNGTSSGSNEPEESWNGLRRQLKGNRENCPSWQGINKRGSGFMTPIGPIGSDCLQRSRNKEQERTKKSQNDFCFPRKNEMLIFNEKENIGRPNEKALQGGKRSEPKYWETGNTSRAPLRNLAFQSQNGLHYDKTNGKSQKTMRIASPRGIFQEDAWMRKFREASKENFIQSERNQQSNFKRERAEFDLGLRKYSQKMWTINSGNNQHGSSY